MAKISIRGDDFSLTIPKDKFHELDFDPRKSYEIHKVKNGIYVLLEGKEYNAKEELTKKVLNILKNKSLSDRVEGKFEKILKPEELAVFNDLLRSGLVVKFKLNENYKNAVYKIREGLTEKEDAKVESKPKCEADSLDECEYIITKSETLAKRLSGKYEDQIKSGDIKGIKNFDGEYFIIKKEPYEKNKGKIIQAFENNRLLDLNDLEKKLNTDKDIIRIILEFLKEDGQLIEKRKNLYQYVD